LVFTERLKLRKERKKIKKALKKSVKIRVETMRIPKTKTMIKYIGCSLPLSKMKRIFFNYEIQDPKGGLVAAFLHNVIPPELLNVLTKSTQELYKHYPPVPTRRKHDTYHFGTWRRYKNCPSLCADTKSPGFKIWYKANASLFALLESLFEKRLPENAKIYRKLGHPQYRFGCFPSCAVNVNTLANLHKDKSY
jgi:hypothetical protein